MNDKFHEEFYGRFLIWLQMKAILFLGWGCVVALVAFSVWLFSMLFGWHPGDVQNEIISKYK